MQSLYTSNIHGEEHKTSDCECGCVVFCCLIEFCDVFLQGYKQQYLHAYADGPVFGVFYCSSFLPIIHLPFFLTCRYLGQLRRGSVLLE